MQDATSYSDNPVMSVPLRQTDVIRPPRTAAIILNWNNARDTLECLKALAGSDVPVLPVVVDNASTAEPRIDKVCREFPDVVLLRNKTNLGFGRANNVGLKWALENTSAQYLLILNNDAFVEADTIRQLETHLDASPETGCVTPQIVFADAPDVVWYGGGEVSWKKGSATVWNYQGMRDQSLAARSVTFASGCAMLLRREVIERIGGFDPRYFPAYEEDVDLSLRILASGFQIDYLPSAVLRHRVQGSRRGLGGRFARLNSPRNPDLPFFMYHRVAHRLLTMSKHARGLNLMRFLFGFHVLLLLRTFQFLRSRRFDAVKAIACGYLHFLRIRKIAYVDQIRGGSANEL